MEKHLADNLLTLAFKFSELKRLELSTVGKNSAADGRFFTRIRDGKTFTVRKYDHVIRWFSDHWPEDAVWPDGISRPLCGVGGGGGCGCSDCGGSDAGDAGGGVCGGDIREKQKGD